ncbi:MAG TPA: hypothetical protein VNI84_07085 [Pyrinomonadaceae bacterium]|nr:hypothetical protein [Pyrinomonadaceae bacterium]
MKKLSEKNALSELEKLKTEYRSFIKINYEYKAASCATCPTKGACCLDTHFVNVHITKLEAVAIGKTLENLSREKQGEIYERATETVKKYDLKGRGDTFEKTFACPLFEKGVGCLVHSTGKPAPCISHACYENKEDLPPEYLQERIETSIEKLNKRVYGNGLNLLPLPVWIELVVSGNND